MLYRDKTEISIDYLTCYESEDIILAPILFAAAQSLFDASQRPGNAPGCAGQQGVNFGPALAEVFFQSFDLGLMCITRLLCFAQIILQATDTVFKFSGHPMHVGAAGIAFEGQGRNFSEPIVLRLFQPGVFRHQGLDAGPMGAALLLRLAQIILHVTDPLLAFGNRLMRGGKTGIALEDQRRDIPEPIFMRLFQQGIFRHQGLDLAV
ncbi:hypothetical protein [Gemmobacter nanjingensis]|uniref:hypothetical protein n=1 Tax=Gemmobacter nanjingensis TaxID=488454 RepID=UPI0016732DB8|nr:hypothetical protein [Gemmobacter nanjingensis]